MKKEIILDTDPNLVEWKTVEGWVGKDGRFYGDDKRQAIYNNHTHKKCEKGHVYTRYYINCPECAKLTIEERYLKLDFVEYDGKTPLALYDDERYFSDEDAVLDYANDNDLEVSDIKLVICVPERLSEVDEEYFIEAIPEDWSLEDTNPEVYLKLQELNEVIRNSKTSCWYPGNKRTTLNL